MALRLNHRLIGSILVPVVAIFLIAITLIGYFWVNSEYQALEQDNQRYAAEYIEARKLELQNEVLRAASMIENERRSAEKNLSQTLKERVHEAHNVATGLYQHYQGKLPEAEIQQKAIEALRYQRWQDGSRYFFIATTDGVEKLYPPNPAFENKRVEDIFGAEGKHAIDLSLQAIERNKEGVVRYSWNPPLPGAQMKLKLSYVKLFEPWNWILGTGEYVNDFNQALRHRIYQNVAAMRHVRNNRGYFFITDYDGAVHVTRHSFFPEAPSLLNVTNEDGVPVVLRNIETARQSPAGGFTRYRWPTESGEQAEKISFVKAIDGWDLLIGTGIYLDEMKAEISAREHRLAEQLGSRIQSVVVILIIALLVIALSVSLLIRKLRINMRVFQESFSEAADSRVRIEVETIHFDEFKQLAYQANSMIDSLNQQTEELRHRAYHDDLTGLPNRLYSTRHLSEMIEQARRQQGRVALMFIDLDNFKEINDTLGHSAGDMLLKMVASRLQSVTRPEDMVARPGGDEFTIVTDLISAPIRLSTLAEKVLGRFQEPFIISGQPMHVSASIGVSTYPANGNTAELLLRNADSAMYKAKSNGKNGYSLYDTSMTDEVMTRLATVEALREAIDQQQFILYFQPQVDTSSGRVIGAEALIRWMHPEKGMIPPGDFIPYAEASGQIAAMGEWVLDEACRKMVEWQARGLELERISVNISGHQMKDKRLVTTLKEILRRTGCPAEALELEITESVLMDNPGLAATILEQFQSLGIRVAIDDFGTGYSSLSYLKRLPINKLKIDRSFIDELHVDGHDQAITRAIIALAQNLNLEVIAEGVENIDQLNRLRELGCNHVQGFHFSRPLPDNEFINYIDHAAAELDHDELILDIDSSDP